MPILQEALNRHTRYVYGKPKHDTIPLYSLNILDSNLATYTPETSFLFIRSRTPILRGTCVRNISSLILNVQ